MSRALDLDAVLADPGIGIVVCCGAGGVGKTTVAAALALRAAESGRTVVVLTIDPARRLAQSLGLRELDNTPREVAGIDSAEGGRLDAMMLDMKRTFDEIVVDHASPEKAEQILANPFYQSLSSSFAGTQEYMAMEKLGQLQAAGTWDLVVVDTPPSRSALDFLDAPKRLGSFLDGRFLKVLMAPAKAGGRAYVRVLSAGVGMMTNVVARVLGAQFLTEVQGFVAALDTMFGGFRERSEATYRLLKDPGTSFVVVAAPERDALREASYFVDRLATEGMPLAGLVLNRVHRTGAERLSAERAQAAAETLAERSADPAAAGPAGASAGASAGNTAGDSAGNSAGNEDAGAELTIGLLRLHAERMRLVVRERQLQARFSSAHPDVPMVEVPAQPGDVHDLAGLRAIGAALAD